MNFFAHFYSFLWWWCLVGTIVTIYVEIESYRWWKQHGLEGYDLKTLSFIPALILNLFVRIFWPVDILFYNFGLQDDFDEVYPPNIAHDGTI